MELNSLAVSGGSEKTALINFYSALEVLTGGIVSKSTTVLKNHFTDENKKKEFIEAIEKTISDFGIVNDPLARLIRQIHSTKAKSEIDRIHEALNKCKINHTQRDISLMNEQRGSTVHSGASSKTEQAKELVRSWVQKALYDLIESRLMILN